jgi:uncharacterized membrane protein
MKHAMIFAAVTTLAVCMIASAAMLGAVPPEMLLVQAIPATSTL